MDPAQRRVRIEESGKEGVITMAAMGAMKDPMGTLNIVVTLDDGGEVRLKLPPPGAAPVGVTVGPVTYLT